MKHHITLNLAFILLIGLLVSAVLGLAAVAQAGTIVKADGTVLERSYKPSYLVKNNVITSDIKYSGGPTISGRTGRVYDSHPLSHIKTWKPKYKVESK